MPTYDYQCRKCGHRFELFHRITDETPKKCPKCKARARRVPSAGAGLLFKGSGFYITDHRSKSYRERARQEKSGAAGGAGDEGSSGTQAPGGTAGSSGPGGSGRPASGVSKSSRGSDPSRRARGSGPGRSRDT